MYRGKAMSNSVYQHTLNLEWKPPPKCCEFLLPTVRQPISVYKRDFPYRQPYPVDPLDLLRVQVNLPNFCGGYYGTDTDRHKTTYGLTHCHKNNTRGAQSVPAKMEQRGPEVIEILNPPQDDNAWKTTHNETYSDCAMPDMWYTVDKPEVRPPSDTGAGKMGPPDLGPTTDPSLARELQPGISEMKMKYVPHDFTGLASRDHIGYWQQNPKITFYRRKARNFVDIKKESCPRFERVHRTACVVPHKGMTTEVRDNFRYKLGFHRDIYLRDRWHYWFPDPRDLASTHPDTYNHVPEMYKTENMTIGSGRYHNEMIGNGPIHFRAVREAYQQYPARVHKDVCDRPCLPTSFGTPPERQYPELHFTK